MQILSNWKLLTKYVTALKDIINSRFEDALSVLKAFDIFNPVSLPERTAAEFIDYGVTSLEKLIESFFPVTEPDKKNEIVTEWNKIKYNMLEWKKRIQTHNNSSDLSETQLMLKMMLMRKTDLSKFFPHIIELAEICQSLPVSNAWPERGASTIKRIKTRLRSTLKQDMIMTLMNVSINGSKTENSQQVTEKAVKHWRNEKDRRKLPKQKPYNKTYENEEAHDNVTKTVEAECQTDITGDNHREMLREEVRVACKQMMIEFETDDYELYDNDESDNDSDCENEFD